MRGERGVGLEILKGARLRRDANEGLIKMWNRAGTIEMGSDWEERGRERGGIAGSLSRILM